MADLPLKVCDYTSEPFRILAKDSQLVEHRYGRFCSICTHTIIAAEAQARQLMNVQTNKSQKKHKPFSSHSPVKWPMLIKQLTSRKVPTEETDISLVSS